MDVIMKLCSMLVGGSPCVGVKTEDGVVNVTAEGFPVRMNDVIEGGSEMLARISEALLAGNHTILNESEIEFLPVTEPKKILCEGLNYKAHVDESGGEDVPKYPIFFSKFSDSLSAHNKPSPLPPWLNRYDYEAELVVVIGKPAYNISADEAEAHIFGYTCGNDLSARDAQFLSSQWLSGKALPGFAPVGPYIATRDSFDPYADTGIYCELNGKTVQSAHTSDMIFPCFEAVSAASRFFPLSPGDLLFTGTPSGVILGRKKEDRVWLKPGDVVKVTIEGVGTLTTPLI